MTFVQLNTYMGLRQSKHLIRTVLILISFQFLASAFVIEAPQEGSIHFSSTIHKHAAHSLTFASLFEKNETEGEEERFKFEAVELEDISTSFPFRSETFQSLHFIGPVIFTGSDQPLFRLHCVFLI